MSLLNCFTLCYSLLLSLSFLPGVCDNSCPTLPFCRLPSYSHSSRVYVYTNRQIHTHKCFTQEEHAECLYFRILQTEVRINTRTNSCMLDQDTLVPRQNHITFCFTINIRQQRWSCYIKRCSDKSGFCECFRSLASCKSQRSQVTLCCN